MQNEIHAMEIALRTLKDQHENAQAFLCAHKGLFCRAHDLPNEVLCHIFLLCLDEHGCFPIYGDGAPWNISAVCHRWRQVAVNIPSLWSGLSLAANRYTDISKPGRLATVLERRQQQLLTLDISWAAGLDENSWLFFDFEQIFNSVQHLRLRGDPFKLSLFADAHCGEGFKFPVLRKLSLTATFDIQEIERTHIGPSMSWDSIVSHFRGYGPFESLEMLIDIGESYFPIDIDLNLVGLEQVFVGLKSLNFHCHDSRNATEVMQLCKSLTSLTLVGYHDFDEPPLAYQPPQIILPSLQTAYLEQLGDLPLHVKCPSLRHLRLAVDFPPEHLHRLLSNSQCQLESLDVAVHALDDEDAEMWIATLPLLSTVKTLAIRIPLPTLREFLPPITSSDAFPELRRLTLNIHGKFEYFSSGRYWGMDDVALGDFIAAQLEHRMNGTSLERVELSFDNSRPLSHFLHSARNEQSGSPQVSSLSARLRAWKDAGVSISAMQQLGMS